MIWMLRNEEGALGRALPLQKGRAEVGGSYPSRVLTR